jgi:hypothetical protein
VCEALARLVVQLRNVDDTIARLERTIAKLAQRDETARRLVSIPGFGPITTSAMAATMQDMSSFAGPREFAAFLGLTPKQNSSRGKRQWLGQRISGQHQGRLTLFSAKREAEDMTAPATGVTPKIALDQQASCRHDRYLRTGDGGSRRRAVVADRVRGRDNWGGESGH